MRLRPYDNSVSIAAEEERILQLWERLNAFHHSVESRSARHPFVFLDGPPFATGTPHYGHLLQGTTKDLIPRYKTMQGYRVERRFGWDCHGVPVEFEVQKDHGLAGKPDIERIGIPAFNRLCRAKIDGCEAAWEPVVERMGRWIDFQNDYKTLYPSYMQSVWWVFQTLYERGHIYEGTKVIPYSPKLGSPLSNFEANEGYADIDDPAVTVEFLLEDGTIALAWTTTPWTLPANRALGFGRDTEYSLVHYHGKSYWLATDAVARYFTEGDYRVERTQLGRDFSGMGYTPLFDFASGLQLLPGSKSDGRAFVCLHDAGDYVTTSQGTGIVHFAPAYGAEDAELCREQGVYGVDPIDMSGYFTAEIPALEGIYFRDDPVVEGSKEANANRWVMATLQAGGQLYRREQIRHSYPHCYRTDCALMYRAIKTWFVDVQQLKPAMIRAAESITWVPEHVKHGRFGNGLASAPDWAISRNRYWGTPMPVWRCEETGETQIIGSIAELEAKSGQTVDDLHRESIDSLTWTGEQGGTMRRIPEVLDCWFESGSMPYASLGYPYETDTYRKADFIAEAIEQTRTWFYSLHVLGVALWGESIFSHAVCSGLLLAEGGKKLSKRKKNYKDPMTAFAQYGADAVRFSMMTKPVVRGEDAAFTDRGCEEVLKSIVLPLRSAYSFLQTYASIDGWAPTQFLFVRHGEADSNVRDYWSVEVENDDPLTPKGREQVAATAAKLGPIDALYASPLLRTVQTAEILQSGTGYTGEIQTDLRLRERYTPTGNRQPRHAPGVRESLEPYEDVRERVQQWMVQTAAKHPGQRVVVACHAVIGGIQERWEWQEDGLRQRYPHLHNAEVQERYLLPEPATDLDRWILSELQQLTRHLTTRLDRYEIDHAYNALSGFIDQLNNWYIRRSRRRFWASGMTDAKRSGYQTLDHVLRTVSKLIAPVMPFLAEDLWQRLGGEGSVHWQYWPLPQPQYDAPELSATTATMREIVRLAGAVRSRAGVRLRQPIARMEVLLPEGMTVDTAILADECNVEEVVLVRDIAGKARQIIAVDAKKVGPRLGRAVQEVIQQGKAGQYTLQPDGTAVVGGHTLAPEEFLVQYVCNEGYDADSSRGIVVVLDTQITPALHRAGLAREITRAVQELRKSEGFAVEDHVHVTIATESPVLEEVLSEHQERIMSEVLASSWTTGTGQHLLEIDGNSLSISLTKVCK
ncbi:isoleucine--tRNA ligase [Candidatus Peribacteria bacterium]|nr:isoleucine--tRNA ligase [Candidatus Peribacteria bacterium]